MPAMQGHHARPETRDVRRNAVGSRYTVELFSCWADIAPLWQQLRVDVTGYGALLLNQASRPVLRGEHAVRFRQEADVEKKKTPKTRGKAPVDLPADRQYLLEALRMLRRELAETQGVPSFVIFHDTTLAQLAMQRPQNRAQLAAINGIGAQKLERYGAALLDVLRAHAA